MFQNWEMVSILKDNGFEINANAAGHVIYYYKKNCIDRNIEFVEPLPGNNFTRERIYQMIDVMSLVGSNSLLDNLLH